MSNRKQRLRMKEVAKLSNATNLKSNNYSSAARKLNQQFWNSLRLVSVNNNDPYQFINPNERQRINSLALDLYRSSPIINAAINRKNEWACATGWKPMFTGADKNWGKLALDYLNNEALLNVNAAGPNNSWNRTLLTIANQIDIFGDSLLVWLPTDTGFQIAVYPSSLVGQRQSSNVVQSGQYVGKTIDDGVVTLPNGYPIAYNILQDTADEDYFLNIRKAQLVFEPTELCKRGMSILTSPLLPLMDSQEIHGYLNRGLKKFSKLPVIVNTQTGTGEDFLSDGPGEIESTSEANESTAPNVVEFGDYTFFKAGMGEKFEIPSSENPSQNAVEWLRHVGEECAGALGWPYGLLHPSQLKGSVSARAMEAQVQQTIIVRQQTLLRIAKQFTTMTIARAMDSGRLPRKTDGDWNAFTYSMPPEFVIDSYYADQTDLQGLKAGTKTLQDVVSRNGGDWEQLTAQKMIENKVKLDQAKELVAHSSGSITFERALDMVGNYGNINAAPIQEQLSPQIEGQ